MNIIGLNDEQRMAAAERARTLVMRSLGAEPQWDMYRRAEVGRYPGWVMRVVGVLMGLVFLASAAPSLFRLFTAGRNYFLQGIDDHGQAVIVGVSTFLLSEFLIILSTISAKIFFEGRGRFIFIVPVVLGLAMALVGNWTVVQPHDLFSWLETVVPVSTVLFVAVIGERLLLEAVERQHQAKRAYAEALDKYKRATHDPEAHPKYKQFWANQIKREIIAVNSKGAGGQARREYLATITPDQWRDLVNRELTAQDWYTPVEEPKHIVPFGHTALIEAGPGSMQMSATGEFSSNGHTAHASVN
jgi:hypothetical protein